MAERLGTGLQNLVHRFNSGSRLQPWGYPIFGRTHGHGERTKKPIFVVENER